MALKKVIALLLCMSGVLAKERPNIILILADDMGYSDLGCYGGEIETPHLDSLAEGGVRLTQFYNAARCCPSRASLMTGLYPHNAGVGFMTYADWGKGYEGTLKEECLTLAEALKSLGYTTFTSGKWHIAAHNDPPAYSLPENRGFDRSTVVRTHIDSYWKVLSTCDVYQDGKVLIPGDNEKTDLKNPYAPEEDFYATDFFTDVALEYMDDALHAENPFFLYLAYNAPHFPLEAPDETIAKYEQKFKDEEWLIKYGDGWDEMREKKLQRQKKLGVVPPEQSLPEVRYFNNQEIMPGLQTGVECGVLPKWKDLPDYVKEEMRFRRAIYNAQIDNMDTNIGRLIQRLKERGEFKNTLFLFMSDNGCSGEMGVFGTHFEGGKYDYTEGVFKDGVFTAGGKQEKDAWATRDSVEGAGYKRANYDLWKKESGWATSQGQGWSSYSNSPFKKFKKFAHEGGISSPLIMHWGEGLEERGLEERGSVMSDGVFHFIDVMPTLLEIAGDDRERESLEGVSILPFLRGEKSDERELFWQHETHAAVRSGDWKLITDNDREDPIIWGLYHLSKDRAETNNLSEENPTIVKELATKWLEFAKSANVIPFPEKREF